MNKQDLGVGSGGAWQPPARGQIWRSALAHCDPRRPAHKNFSTQPYVKPPSVVDNMFDIKYWRNILFEISPTKMETLRSSQNEHFVTGANSSYIISREMHIHQARP